MEQQNASCIVPRIKGNHDEAQYAISYTMQKQEAVSDIVVTFDLHMVFIH